MEDPIVPVEPVADDESALDASINDTISQIKAEHPVAANPPKPAETVPDAAAKAKVSEIAPSAEQPTAEVVPPKKDGSNEEPASAYEFRDPVKGKSESDESFQLRVQLSDLVKAKKAANTDVEKENLQAQIKELREVVFPNAISKNQSRTQPFINNGGASPDNVQPAKADPNAKSLTEAEVTNLINKREYDSSVKSTLDSFIESSPELQDSDVREVYFNLIDANYNWQGKTGKELRTVLDLAKRAMFPPSETIQEAVIKGAKVQEKVNAMQFPGGSIVKPGLTPGQQKDVDDMVATGMSEAKARALIFED